MLDDDQATKGALEEPGSHVWKTLKVKESRELPQGIWKWVKGEKVERKVWERKQKPTLTGCGEAQEGFWRSVIATECGYCIGWRGPREGREAAQEAS